MTREESPLSMEKACRKKGSYDLCVELLVGSIGNVTFATKED